MYIHATKGLLLVAAMALVGGYSAADDKTPDPKTTDEAVSRAVAFLKAQQAKDGSWTKSSSYGVTGLVLTGLFKSGKVKAGDETAAGALKFIEAMIDNKEGHIANVPKGVRGFHKNYLTSVNLVALQNSGLKKYDAPIAKATAYLKALQWDEKKEMTAKDAFYGGVGYGPNTRPDLSNTHFFLEAMKAAKVPASDDVYKKAQVFVSRCQNLKGEHNDQPWAGKINDGSFIYVLDAGSKGKTAKDAPRPGYGSMTFAGLKALRDCGVAKTDQRIKKALEWVNKHYTVSENPGRAEDDRGRGYYYYTCMMAECLDALGVEELVDAGGKKHAWRAELRSALLAKQRKDGSWVNATTGWMEGNPEVCTAFALAALSYCNPRAK